MAAYHGRLWAVSTLLRLGADHTAENDEHRRPIDIARHDSVRSMFVWPKVKGFMADDHGAAIGVEVLDRPVGRGVGTSSSDAGLPDGSAGELGEKGVDVGSTGDENRRGTKDDFQHGDVHEISTINRYRREENRMFSNKVVSDERPRGVHPARDAEDGDPFEEESSDGTCDSFQQ